MGWTFTLVDGLHQSGQRQQSAGSIAGNKILPVCGITTYHPFLVSFRLLELRKRRAGDHVKHMECGSVQRMPSNVKPSTQRKMVMRDAVHEKAELTSLT